MGYLKIKPIFYLNKKNKINILNIAGLSIAFTFISLIVIFVTREFSYDRFHAKASSIYLLERILKKDDGTSQKNIKISINQVGALKTKIPGISNVAFLNYHYFDWEGRTWIQFDNKTYQINRMAFTDATFADIFSFKTISGNLKDVLNDPGGLVLTKDNAQKIFGDTDPTGKNVLLNNRPVIIKAIIEKNPYNSSIRFDGLINYQAAQYITGYPINDASNIAFLELDPKANIKNIEIAIGELFLQNLPPENRNILRGEFNVKIIPLRESYFNEAEAYDPMFHGNKILVRIILVIGILILILAVINYINLSFAGYFRQMNELAIRNIFGAGRTNLIMQFIMQGVLISFFAFVLSILFCEISLSWFNKMIDYPISSNQLLQFRFVLFMILIVLATGLVSGIFPALSATRYTPQHQIKGGNLSKDKSKKWKCLLLFQMIISIGLISGTITIIRQISFVKNIDMGFKIKDVVTIPVIKLGNRMALYQQSIENHPMTEAIALSSPYLNTFNKWNGILDDGQQKKEISFLIIQANKSFLNATGIQLKIGRNFEKESSIDASSCIINETAVKQFGLTDPLSSSISGKTIVGVVKDFHIQSLRYKVGPVVIFNYPENKLDYVTICFKAENKSQISDYIAFLKAAWERISTDIPFEYEFLDQRLRNMYEKDERLMNAFLSFSFLVIIIASLGLFGLISLISETKVKEIGIRKVNGAKVAEILVMLNREFIILFSIAYIIAIPVSWLVLLKWLENFAYKTDLRWWIFALTGLIALFISLLTVSWQSWRAATRNPVEALRYE